MINLRKCKIGARGVKALFDVMMEKGSLPNLEKLDLSLNESIADEGIAAIVRALQGGRVTRKIKMLNFESTGMMDVGGSLLGEAFAAAAAATDKALPSSLEKVRIDSPRGRTEVSDEGRDALRRGLEQGGWLKKAGLSCEGL